MCNIDCCHWRVLLSTLVGVCHIVPARCKYVAPCVYPLPEHDIISVHFNELLMNISFQHFCAHRKHVTVWTYKWDKWVTMLNCCSCDSSVHVAGVTWLWALEPSVVFVSSIWNLKDFASWIIELVNFFIHPHSLIYWWHL